jgi:transposase
LTDSGNGIKYQETKESIMAKANKKRRVKREYSEEFRRDAVKLVTIENYSFKDAAASLDVGEQSLRNWHKKYAPPPVPCGDDATEKELRAEIKRLTKELKRADLEREILKKATAFFVKESQ